MTITKADVKRIAATWRLIGEFMEVHGELALDVFDGWAKGAATARLDPDMVHANRWQECGDAGCHDCPHAIPSDPTGEAALQDQREEFAAGFQERAERMNADALWLRDAFHVIAPIVPPTSMNEKNDLWCDHHLRIGMCEVRHRGDLCRYCDDFLKLWKIRPPVSILRDRHNGKRITEKMVKEALEADGVILETVAGVTKAIRTARSPRRRNQNEKKAKAS
jgi:hypothetical protein